MQIIFVLLSAVATVGLGNDLVLLQMRAEKLDGIASEDNSPMHTKTSEAYDTLGSQIRAFESSVAETEKRQEAELKAKKVEYATQLVKQQDENRAVATSISSLSAEIEHLHEANAKFRQHSIEIQKENRRLVGSFHSFEANLTLAQEFIDKALVTDTDAAELRVLKELDEDDESRKATEAHRHRLNEIGGADKKHTALLETHDDDTKELLRSLESRLVDVVDEHAAGEAALKGRFDAKLTQLMTRNAALVQEHEELEGSKASLVQLSDRLQTAVHHLEHTHTELSKKVRSLTYFVRLLGEEDAAPEGLSLLQRGSVAPEPATQLTAEHTETSVKLVVPSKPVVVHNLSSQIRALQHTVEAQQQETDAAIAHQKASYEHNLSSQRQANNAAVAKNSLLSSHIASRKRDIAALQAQAAGDTQENDRLRKEILDMQAKFTTADEFATGMLHELTNSSSSPALDVLHELSEEKATREQNEIHTHRLQEVAVGSTSLLQGSAMTANAKPAAHEDEAGQLTHLLQGSLESMASEASARKAALKSEFMEKFDAGAKLHAELVAEQVALEGEKATLTKLRSSLKTAVEFLADQHMRLEQGVKSLKGFSQRMGSAI